MKNKQGFTLIELMVAMGIIAVLVTMSVVAIQIVQQNLRNTQRRKTVEELNLWLQSYYNDNSEFPDDDEIEFVSDRINFTGGAQAVIVTQLKGATASASQGGDTSSSQTKYCYDNQVGAFSVGAKLEGGGTIFLGTGTSCTL